MSRATSSARRHLAQRAWMAILAIGWSCSPFAAGPTGDAGTGDASAETPVPSADASVDEARDAEKPDGNVPCTEPGAVVRGGRCYFAIKAGGRAASKAGCSASGAHLTTLTTQQEQTFVLTTFAVSDAWVGLEATPPSNDKAAFKWSTGEPVGFTAWDTSDPNEATGCVILKSNDRWSDRPCTDSYDALCERE